MGKKWALCGMDLAAAMCFFSSRFEVFSLLLATFLVSHLIEYNI